MEARASDGEDRRSGRPAGLQFAMGLGGVLEREALLDLDHDLAALDYVEQLRHERDRVVAKLQAAGCEVPASDANFVQFGRFKDSRAAWQALLRRGVLVRDNGVPGWLRASTGTPDENDAFLGAVHELLLSPQGALQIPGPQVQD